MTIPRFHLFELEDQPRFPNLIRDLATDDLQFVEARMKKALGDVGYRWVTGKSGCRDRRRI